MVTVNLTDAEKARNIALAANDLQASLLRDDRHYSTRSFHRLLVLCNAVIDLIDDGDCMAQREILMSELRCDEGGNPVDGHGFPFASFNPSLVHPNDPCQSKGYGA